MSIFQEKMSGLQILVMSQEPKTMKWTTQLGQQREMLGPSRCGRIGLELGTDPFMSYLLLASVFLAYVYSELVGKRLQFFDSFRGAKSFIG